MQKRIVNRKLFLGIVLFFVIIFSLNIISQTKKSQLSTKREKLLKEIEYTTKLLNNTTQKKGKTLQRIHLIDRKLARRKEIIELYKVQLIAINSEISDKEDRIKKLNQELEVQKKFYADFIYYAYKNQNSYNSIIFLLASNTLNQFYLRKKYLDQLREARLKKMLLVEAIAERINLEVKTLLKTKNEKSQAILAMESEKRELATEKKEREKRVNELSLEEKSLRADIAEKKRIEEEIGRRLKDLIREETKNSNFATLTPEQQLVSTNFESNKGRLPWPTKQGLITEKFGKHRHPVISSVQTFNSGVDITTVDNDYVRAIFNGTVSKIFSIKGANYTVIVRHGTYYSVYHNLTDIKVNVGDNIKTKDIIGRVSKRPSDGSSIVHLEIWKGLVKLNPEDWISK
jgi:murein hydrolase activator